ncbi:hypothetical protein [Metaclostridioides mangenotii]|uniref:Nitrate reductase NapAB chaperone NapD n=1 Tax=Metaclostridioides mangenotii TaxID=1540 RepID=A0ABS4E6Z4_9FIRM|nr:hypothetical protein [Clostridioides mangenotii]MBP1853693.1 nitrate reductase NapAB chaperone NapD [Clostridioides mangenotii]
MDKLKGSMMVVDSNINTVEEMLKDNEIRLSEIKRTAVKYCSRDEGKIENQQLVVNDLKSQLKMAKIIRKDLVLTQEREEQKEKSRSNDSIQELQNIITLIIPQEA